MDLNFLFSELNKKNKVLLMSFVIHFPLVYTIGYFMYPSFISMDLFPQIMIISAFSIITTMADAIIPFTFAHFLGWDIDLSGSIYISIFSFAILAILRIRGPLTEPAVFFTYLAMLSIGYLAVVRVLIKLLLRIRRNLREGSPNRNIADEATNAEAKG